MVELEPHSKQRSLEIKPFSANSCHVMLGLDLLGLSRLRMLSSTESTASTCSGLTWS